MKVIDLLNKIANGEDIPKKIKVNNMFIYEYENGIDYKTKDGTYLFNSYVTITKEDMNMEIEIIEDKKIVKLNNNIAYYSGTYETRWNDSEMYIVDKINEIIDRLNGEDNE